MKYANRADLLIAAGESIKMQEKFGITDPVCKFCGEQDVLSGRSFDCPQDYEFPLAVVEGKPVFVGDELYHSIVGKCRASTDCAEIGGMLIGEDNVRCFSWNPPKPKTVMVELL